MNIKIHSIRFNADKKLLDFLKSKLEKLLQFYDDIITAEVYLRLEKSRDADNKIVEIKLMIPGNEFFAKRQSRTFEEAADQSMEALRRQINKHKTKLRRA